MDLSQTNFNYSILIKGKLWYLNEPRVMGILNLTPDSFYDGGLIDSQENALSKVNKMTEEGADMVDIGAMSSRPFSQELPLEVEMERIKRFLPLLIKEFPNTIFSIDSYRSEVAEYALDNGASIVNDITAGLKDEKIWKIAQQYQAPYIAMHMQGNPNTMQENPRYNNILVDIFYFFSERLHKIKQEGLSDIILDVGFGFGKTIEDNFNLLKNLNYFKELNCPILAGISRKSMIYKTLDISPQEALNGTSALHFEALRNGANILRVHDVKEAREVVKLYKKYEMVGD